MFDFLIVVGAAYLGASAIASLGSSFASMLGGVSSAQSAKREAEQAHLRHKAMAEQVHTSRNRDQAAILARGGKDDEYHGNSNI